MRKSGFFPVFLALLAAANTALAQVPPAPEAKSTKKEFSVPERKAVGWFFNKPTKTNAVEQFAYAGQLVEQKKKGAAAGEYNALVCSWPESPEASRAQLKYAMLLEEEADYEAAFDQFQYLIHYYAGTFDYDEVLSHQFRIANVIRGQRRLTLWVFPGFSAADRAIPYYEKIVRNGPSWSHSPEAQFCIGTIYEDLEQYDDAIGAFDVVQNRYPDSSYAAESSFRRATCFYRLAKKTPRNENSVRDGMSSLASFIAAHRDNPNVDKAKEDYGELRSVLAEKYYEQARFYDSNAFGPKAAVVAYGDFIRKFPGVKQAEIAQKRIDALRAETDALK